MNARLSAVLLSILCTVSCAHDSGRKLTYCDCQMWGVVGAYPGPDYQPPPPPRQCKRILKQKPEHMCPPPP